MNEAELAAWGFKSHEVQRSFPEIWAENWPAVRLFIRVGSQWRAGMGGPYALDHTTVLLHMQRMDLTDDEHEQLLDDISEMEHAALEAMSEQKE
jgi:hypothetical protein